MQKRGAGGEAEAARSRKTGSQLVSDEPQGDAEARKAADKARRRLERKRAKAEAAAAAAPFVPDHTEAWAELAQLKPEDTVTVDEDGRPMDGQELSAHHRRPVMDEDGTPRNRCRRH